MPDRNSPQPGAGLDHLERGLVGAHLNMTSSRKDAEFDLRLADVVDPSVGTAYELGFMRGLNKPVFAYSNESRLFTECVRAAREATSPSSGVI